MAIDIGDAVLTFLGDTTQLDAAFDKVGTEAPAKLAPAAAAIGALGTKFETTGAQGTEAAGTLADAWKLIPPVVAKTDAELQNMAFALRNVAVAATDAGEQTALAAVKGGEKIRILDEAIGIRLPRGVTRFISELVPLGGIMDAAFAASVIFIVVEALAKGVEKLVEWSHDAEEIAKAMDTLHVAQEKTFHDLEDNLIRAELKTAELTGDHLEALRLKLQLIDNTTLGKLRGELEKLGQEADKDFEKFNRSWFSQIFLGLEGGEAATKKLDDVGKAVDKALSARTPEAFTDALKLVDAAVGDTEKKLTELNKQQADAENIRKSALQGRGRNASGFEPVDPKTIQSYQEASRQLQEFKKDIEEAQKAEQQEAASTNLEDKLKQLEEQKTLAKDVLDTTLLAVEKEKLAEEAAFADRKITAQQWAAAQIKAANDAAKANEDYKDKLAQIANEELVASRAVDANASSLKAKSAAVDAANERTKQQNIILKQAADGLLKAQEETAKLRKEMEKLVFPVEKAKDQTQALKELENAEKQLADAQKALALAQSTQDFKEQESAIKQLAQLRIISKEQEAAQLARIARNEEDAQLAVLKDQLAKEEKELLAAKAKFTSGQLDPLTSPEELTRLRTALAQKQAAFDKTETEILNRSTSTSDKMIANDRSYYGRSLALLLAFGNTEEAARLKSLNTQIAENKVKLQAAQADLAAARAKGQETKAIQDQITQLQRLIVAEQREEKQLEQAAHKGLSAWKQFSQGFRAEAQENQKTLADMAQEMRKDAQEFASDLGSEFASAALGQESASEAMLHSTEKLVGKMAQQWGEYFAAMAIADLLTPGAQAKGAAEMAASVALFTLSGVLGGLAGSGGSGSSGSSTSASTGTPGPAPGSPAATAGGVPVSTLNVPRLSGGLVTQPTIAVVGGSGGGGSAIKQIQAALAAHAAGGGDIHIKIETDLLSSARVISNNVKSGRVRMTSSNTLSPRGRRS